MFLCQPLLDVLIGRGIEDVDSFVQPPSWSDLPDPLSMTGMMQAVDRVLAAIRDKQRITVFGDYDCDGILGTHILRSALSSFGVPVRSYLPHRDEGYGLSSCAVHKFSMSGTDLLITIDNGINARREILLALRLGVDVIVVDHHRIQEQANTLAVWSQEFCGAGLAALFAMTLALRASWKDERVERLQAAMSQYAAIASVADCVPLQNGTRKLARLGMRELARAENCGLRELLRVSCTDPANPDSNDIAFGLAPRINAAGRTALFVFITSEAFLAADYSMYHAYRLQVIADRQLLIPHTICGFIALLAGPVQFSSRFRQRHLIFHRVLGRMYVISVFIGAFTGIALAAGRPGLPGTSMQAAAWIVCTTAAFLTARNRQIAQHRQWMARSYAVTFTFVSSRVLNLWPRYWSHLGDSFAAVGFIAFTLASLLLVDLGLNWRELTTRRA